MNQIKIQKKLKTHIINMLESILTMAELTVLAKNKGIAVRGISKEELTAFVADKFLEPRQISQIYEDLNEDFQFLLHYLKAQKEPVELKIAIRYLADWKSAQAQGSYYAYIKPADYRGLFSQLKTSLAVNGLIVIIKAADSYSFDSKFERFSLYFPEEFHPFLPPLPIVGVKKDQKEAGNSFEVFAKNMLLCSLGLRLPKDAIEKTITKMISWPQGLPHFRNTALFEAGNYPKRVYSAWREGKTYSHYYEKVDTVNTILYLLEQLPKGEWLELSQIQELVGRFTRFVNCKELQEFLPAVCDDAVSISLFEKMTVSPHTYYRVQADSLALIKNPGNRVTSKEGLSAKQNGSISVDFKQTSVLSLFEILLISDWTPSTEALLCYPSLIKCGKIFRRFSNFSKLRLYEYLSQNSISYKNTFCQIEKDFGKFMIHTNLSIFEITDRTISALLQHTYPESFYPLGDNFFALSESDENEILRFLEKKKYSIKIKDQCSDANVTH